MNYFDRIRKLNNLQMAYFFDQVNADLELVALALSRADNPEIYCSEDNFAIGTPKKNREWYDDAKFWWRNLSHDYDEDMNDILHPEYSEYVRGSDRDA